MEAESGDLGLGLNALFDEEENASVVAAIEEKIESDPENTRKRHSVGVEQLSPSEFQPRRIFDEDSISELASSIKQYGVLQPLLVRQSPSNPEQYEIIAGERRWRAAQEAQLHDVPVIVLELSELDAFKIALIENLQREDLNVIDEALGYERLLDNYNLTQDELAKAVGKSRPHITNTVRLLTLPSIVQAHVGAGDISMGHARALITAEDPEALVKQVIAKGLSVRQTEKFAMEKKGVPQQKRPKSSAPSVAENDKDSDTVALENDISNALGMRVTIDSADGKSGKLSVEFKSLEQLDEVLHRLAHFPGSRLNG
ncbi:MAG: chromosome partitioning protein ParB [Alphaproteobacteria bacterium]|nr:MAG: chromosome partitioning protein ParB [Alphaproteobacteria bacterium]